VVGRFAGGTITSDAGGLLLREVERRTRMMRHFKEWFRDERKEKWVEPSVEELVRQRQIPLPPFIRAILESL
jgi:hypothetical protein